MELKELMSLEAPTTEQCEEMVALLIEIDREAANEIDAIDAETRARGKDRLIGTDHGADARAAARLVALQRREDAGNALGDVRALIAQEQARAEKEADVLAWDGIRALLDKRRAAMAEIDQLLGKIGALYRIACEAGTKAYSEAPVRPPPEIWNHLFGTRPEQLGCAIDARLNWQLNWPIRIIQGSVDMLGVYSRSMADGGLPSVLDQTDRTILGS